MRDFCFDFNIYFNLLTHGCLLSCRLAYLFADNCEINRRSSRETTLQNCLHEQQKRLQKSRATYCGAYVEPHNYASMYSPTSEFCLHLKHGFSVH